MKKSLSLSKVYQLIEPGPVVLLSSAFKNKMNVMPMSWHMMIEFEPPLIGCIISNRNFSFDLVRKSKECVINIPTVELAKKVVQCGNVSGRRLNKFERFGLTPVKGSRIEAPLINECYANLECRVVDTRMVNQYNLFILEVVKAWIDPSVKQPKMIHHLGNGVFEVATRRIKLPSKKK